METARRQTVRLSCRAHYPFVSLRPLIKLWPPLLPNTSQGFVGHNVQHESILLVSRLKHKKVCHKLLGGQVSRRCQSTSTTNQQYPPLKKLSNLQKKDMATMRTTDFPTTTREYYDSSLFGLDARLDQAVAQHQRQAMLYARDRSLKDKQAMQVAPGLKQSPIAITSMNPTYKLANNPLVLDYPNTIKNVRLNNTGLSWEIKIPYQIAMNTSLHGAHLSVAQYYRLDHFHCHWGPNESAGSEHIIDGHSYSAELHFVHYNMDKYHSLSKAARHPDGLAVVAVFLDADNSEEQRRHAELDKVVNLLRLVPRKGQHAHMKQPLRLANLLPANKSYWSYQGSLTTPPYLESVTWFILKQPLKCNASQLDSFRSISATLGEDSDSDQLILSNHRQTQPLNGRTIVTYDEPLHKRSHY